MWSALFHRATINKHRLIMMKFYNNIPHNFPVINVTLKQLEMWANAQRDGRPAEYRWRPLFNAEYR